MFPKHLIENSKNFRYTISPIFSLTQSEVVLLIDERAVSEKRI